LAKSFPGQLCVAQIDLASRQSLVDQLQADQIEQLDVHNNFFKATQAQDARTRIALTLGADSILGELVN